MDGWMAWCLQTQNTINVTTNEIAAIKKQSQTLQDGIFQKVGTCTPHHTTPDTTRGG